MLDRSHQLLVSTVLLLLSAVLVSAQLTSQVHISQNTGGFRGNAAALSESVDADGTKRGECAYYDSEGQQIKVRFIQPAGSTGNYATVGGGNSRVDPAVAYKQCVEQARKSQKIGSEQFHRQFSNAAAGFNQFAGAGGAFNPFAAGAGGAFNPFPAGAGGFNQFADAPRGDNEYAGATAGSFVYPESNVGGGFYSGAAAGQGSAGAGAGVNQIAATIETQRRTMNSFNQQIHDNLLAMQQQNLDLHNRLMQQLGR